MVDGLLVSGWLTFGIGNSGLVKGRLRDAVEAARCVWVVGTRRIACMPSMA